MTKLSRQQESVVRLLVMGLSNPQIAARLGLKSSTIKTHLQMLARKFGVKTKLGIALCYVMENPQSILLSPDVFSSIHQKGDISEAMTTTYTVDVL